MNESKQEYENGKVCKKGKSTVSFSSERDRGSKEKRILKAFFFFLLENVLICEIVNSNGNKNCSPKT